MSLLRRRLRLAVEPVRSYPSPQYPTIDTIAQSPASLLHCIPEAWRSNAAALSALAAFVLAGRTQAQEPTKPPAPAEDGAQTADRAAPAKPVPGPSIAPVFVHGEGSGAVGCVVISPPEFLSETEALEIVWQELERENLGFEPRAVRVPGKPGGPQPAGLSKRPLFFDAYSKRLRCGVLVVGPWNYDELAAQREENNSTVSSFDTLGRAQEVTEQLARETSASAAVFYDPLARRDMTPGPVIRSTTRSRELLRAQVREFVSWAKRNISVAPETR